MKFNLIIVSTRSTRILSDLKHNTGLTPNISARFDRFAGVPNDGQFLRFGAKEGSKLRKVISTTNFSARSGFIRRIADHAISCTVEPEFTDHSQWVDSSITTSG